MRFHSLGIWIVAMAAMAADANLIADWNDALVEADAEDQSMALGVPPPNFFRANAIMHLSMFDAVNAIERRFSAFRPTAEFSGPASPEAAAAAAAHTVLVRIYPAHKPALDRRLSTWLRGIPDGASRANGERLGSMVAQALLKERESDRWTAPNTYRPDGIPGHYLPTAMPVFGHMGAAKPFLLERAGQFRPPPPYALTSPEWARDLNEVQARGAESSSVRTAAEAWRAKFIAVSHLKFYIQPVTAIVRNRELPLLDSARLMAALALAAADSFAANFEAKYHHAFWRPVTAIRYADRDGNAATERDAGWRPLIETPMHPEYPCQHCVVAAVTATVLREFFPDQPPVLQLRNAAFSGGSLDFQDYEAMVQATIEARVDGGIHYRMSGEVGAALGRRVARFVIEESLRPLR